MHSPTIGIAQTPIPASATQWPDALLLLVPLDLVPLRLVGLTLTVGFSFSMSTSLPHLLFLLSDAVPGPWLRERGDSTK